MFLFAPFLFLNLESSAEALYYNYEKQNHASLRPTWKPRNSQSLISGATAAKCKASNKINSKITEVKMSVGRRGKV